ncbi:MAG: hypothetical protein IKN72_11825 [Clostridia bacterium]|nr:hypothetical protein [Clostridia bacterium]MBR3554056.1 hypothetical protein [Clostridia bacterium]
MTTAQLIRGIVNYINSSLIDDPSDCEAILSFDDRTVPAPLDKYYFAFLIGSDHVSVENVGTDECCQLIKMDVSMNCYAPPGESAIAVCAYAENILEGVNARYAGMMSGYTIGQAVIDSYLKALKIPCEMHFQFEQCPAFNITDSILRPFADFFCKTHVTDGSVHLTQAERDRISVPIVTGTYTGLGPYNDVQIQLDFAPKFVAVFPEDAAAVAWDSVNSTTKCSFDFTWPGSTNHCLHITAGGFTVHQNTTVPQNSSTRTLNEYGVTYAYVAVK